MQGDTNFGASINLSKLKQICALLASIPTMPDLNDAEQPPPSFDTDPNVVGADIHVGEIDAGSLEVDYGPFIDLDQDDLLEEADP